MQIKIIDVKQQNGINFIKTNEKDFFSLTIEKCKSISKQTESNFIEDWIGKTITL